MRAKVYRIGSYVLFVLCLMMLVGSCQEPPYGMGASPVYILVENGYSTDGSTLSHRLSVDVYNPSAKGYVSDDFFAVQVDARYKNQAVTSPFADVIVQQYAVSYYRPDGNPEVPDPYTNQCYFRIDTPGSYTVFVQLMRREAKLKSPFYDLRFGGGEGSIVMNAVVQFWGEDLMGNKVTLQQPYNVLMFVKDF